jgi:hypothetical protein
VAAFGYHAGFAGAAVGLNVWSRQQVEKGYVWNVIGVRVYGPD